MKKWPQQQPRIVDVQVAHGRTVQLTFHDGTIGETDLSDLIMGQGGVLAALEDPAFFARVRLNHEAGTIEWPNEVDFCPDVLYSRVTGIPIPFAQDCARKH